MQYKAIKYNIKCLSIDMLYEILQYAHYCHFTIWDTVHVQIFVLDLIWSYLCYNDICNFFILVA